MPQRTTSYTERSSPSRRTEQRAACHLSPRMLQVLEALLDGYSEKQIPAVTGCSRHTVHAYVKQIYKRLGVQTRGELCCRFIPRLQRSRLKELIRVGQLHSRRATTGVWAALHVAPEQLPTGWLGVLGEAWGSSGEPSASPGCAWLGVPWGGTEVNLPEQPETEENRVELIERIEQLRARMRQGLEELSRLESALAALPRNTGACPTGRRTSSSMAASLVYQIQ